MTRRAVVVGGASGIGRATARVLAADDHAVRIADIDGDKARAAAGDIGGATTAVTTRTRWRPDWPTSTTCTPWSAAPV